MDSMSNNSLQNIDAEMSVIGACLLDPQETMFRASKVTVNDFADQKLSYIWSAISRLWEQSEPVDLVSVTSELKKQRSYEKAGGNAHLADLLDHTPTAANVGYYVKLIMECSRRRSLAEVGRKITSEAISSKSAIDAVDKADTWLLQQREDDTGAKVVRAADLLSPTFKRLEELHNNGGFLSGLLSGFTDLDKMTCGFQGG